MNPETSSDEANPWQTLASDVRYDNPWICVTEHQVRNPAGKPGIYGVVQFKNVAVGVLPLDDDDHTWLVGQYRYPLQQYSWEIPEGGSPIGGESPEATAHRELQEETGLVATHLQPLLRMHLSNSVSDELALAYLATGLRQAEAQPEETERLQVRRLPFAEALRMVLHGEITDVLSVATILRVALNKGMRV